MSRQGGAVWDSAKLVQARLDDESRLNASIASRSVRALRR